MFEKLFGNMLMATMVICLGMGVVSCKDDDEENNGNKENNKQQEDLQQEEPANVFWDVVGQLTSMDNYTEDYADKTFEPTIGEVSEENANVRIVATNDLETAARRFSNLVNVPVDAQTAMCEYKNDTVGTLTYRKTDNGTSLATVDVRIKQLPQLQQIVYKTPEQMGTNSSIQGTAYHRFGDVVQRQVIDGNKLINEYWVCVRPAFAPEGKDRSFWVTLSPLSSKNLKDYSGSNKFVYSVPTGIGTNEEYMQDFAEMIYAMLFPQKWYDNIQANKNLTTFYDFHHKNIKYIPARFWEYVRYAWMRKDLWQKVFGKSISSEEAARKYFEHNPLYLLHKGYSWWFKVSWNLSLYQTAFSNGNTATTKNMHQVQYTEVKKDVSKIPDLNLHKQYDEGYYGLVSPQFFGDDNCRYIIRTATGKDLFGSSRLSLYSSVENNIDVTEIYSYNKYFDKPVGEQFPPEIMRSVDPKKGDIIGANGLLYNSVADATSAKTKAVAVVYNYYVVDSIRYRSKDEEKYMLRDEALEDLHLLETGSQYYGVAAAFETIKDKTWSDSIVGDGSKSSFCSPVIADLEAIGDPIAEINLPDEKSGLYWTRFMAVNHCDHSHAHPAAEAAWFYDGIPAALCTSNSLSRWFVPTVSQWVEILSNWATFVYGSFDEFQPGYTHDYFSKFYKDKSLEHAIPNGHFWTSTSFDNDSAYVIVLQKGEELRFYPANKHSKHDVLPFVMLSRN